MHKMKIIKRNKTEVDFDISKIVNAVTKANNAAQTAQNAAAQVTGKVDASDLATVATSGKYNDLTGKPDLTKYAKKKCFIWIHIK